MESDLKALLERVEASTGPDRDIDRSILDALGIAVREFDPGDGDVSQWREWGDGSRVANTHVTASVDAARALTERVLPGWSLQLYLHPSATYATLYRLGDLSHLPGGEIERRVTTPYFEGNRDDGHVALAILAATLRALASTGETTGAADG